LYDSGEIMADDRSSRRDFLNFILAGGVIGMVGTILYPAIRYIIPPESREPNITQLKIPFKRADIEADPQHAKTFKFGRVLGIIVVMQSGELRAMSAACTHLGCTVQHRPDLGIIWCSCHNGRFDLEGQVISGPVPRPLTRFVVNEVGDDIFVSKQGA
jgi:cytochrome b6-f complex iron-sulfur subunit